MSDRSAEAPVPQESTALESSTNPINKREKARQLVTAAFNRVSGRDRKERERNAARDKQLGRLAELEAAFLARDMDKTRELYARFREEDEGADAAQAAKGYMGERGQKALGKIENYTRPVGGFIIGGLAITALGVWQRDWEVSVPTGLGMTALGLGLTRSIRNAEREGNQVGQTVTPVTSET